MATAEAHRRLRASDLLMLVQAEQCDGEAWVAIQQRLLTELE